MYLQSGATETAQWLLSVPWSATPTRWKERRNLHHHGRGGSNIGKAYSRSTQSLINAETREFTRVFPVMSSSSDQMADGSAQERHTDEPDQSPKPAASWKRRYVICNA